MVGGWPRRVLHSVAKQPAPPSPQKNVGKRQALPLSGLEDGFSPENQIREV